MAKKKLYVGCGLTHAPTKFHEDVEALKDSLRSRFELLDFIGLEGGTAAEVYNYDIHECVEKADIFLAVADYPSIGLGWELAVAAKRNIPVIIVAHTDSKVTRLLLGAAEKLENIQLFRYQKMSEVAGFLDSHSGEGVK